MAQLNENKVPTLQQVNDVLSVYTASLLNSFQQHKLDGITINAIGRILGGIKFDGSQTQPETAALIQSEAQKVVDEIKLYLLRSSLQAPSLD